MFIEIQPFRKSLEGEHSSEFAKRKDWDLQLIFNYWNTFLMKIEDMMSKSQKVANSALNISYLKSTFGRYSEIKCDK